MLDKEISKWLNLLLGRRKRAEAVGRHGRTDEAVSDDGCTCRLTCADGYYCFQWFEKPKDRLSGLESIVMYGNGSEPHIVT